MATAEQIGMMQLMDCKLLTRAVGENIVYCVLGRDSHGNRWQTTWCAIEHRAWQDAAEFVFSDRSDGLLQT